MTNGYEEEKFWDAYGEYLDESTYRHKYLISLSPIDKLNIIHLLDLGCGQYASARDLIAPSTYVGVDSLNPGARSNSNLGYLITADYRKELPDSSYCCYGLGPNCFTSLFSSEATASAEDNNLLYKKVFETYPSIQYGIVSGFYYRGKENEEVVEEAGGLKSYQTNPALGPENSYYSELNIVIDAPSKLFGPDVVEVWKFLKRK